MCAVRRSIFFTLWLNSDGRAQADEIAAINRQTVVRRALLAALTAFLGWRMVRPPKYFAVSDWFAMPISTAGASPAAIGSVGGGVRGSTLGHLPRMVADLPCPCLGRSSFPSRLASRRQQPDLPQLPHAARSAAGGVGVGFRGATAGVLRWRLIRSFNSSLRQEGRLPPLATSAREDLRAGGGAGSAASHRRLDQCRNEACVRCHAVVNKSRRDSFLSLPPCGTIAEIGRARSASPPRRGRLRRRRLSQGQPSRQSRRASVAWNATCLPSIARR